MIYLLLNRQRSLVIGGGSVAERKVMQLLDSGSKITVASMNFTENLLKLGKMGKIKIIKIIVKAGFINSLSFKPRIIIVALNDTKLNEKLSKESKLIGALVCVVDNPKLSDFTMPAISRIGDFRIGISTNGKSPLMAGEIRKRIEKIITQKDILQIELQNYSRIMCKKYITSQNDRQKVLREIMKNKEINKLLENDNLMEANKLAKDIIIKNKDNGIE